MTDSVTGTILCKMAIAEGCNRSILCMGKALNNDLEKN